MDDPTQLCSAGGKGRNPVPGHGKTKGFLVTFLDNHDRVGQTIKSRFGHSASEEQIIAGVGFLLCSLGTPCIYYGTEQGFQGSGEGDWNVREGMFNQENTTDNVLNKNSRIYLEIARLAEIRRKTAVLKFGRMYMRESSSDGKRFSLQIMQDCMLAFSRILYDEEILVVYNSSSAHDDEEYIAVDRHLNPEGTVFRYCYGGTGKVHVLRSEDEIRHFVKLKLRPGQFVILANRNVTYPFD